MEPWEIKTDDKRIENSIIPFIVFCEDENDEPFYFRSFQVDNKLKVNAIPNQNKAKTNVNNTLVQCEKDGLLECVDHAYRVKEGMTNNIWCVFDRDLENNDLTLIKASDDANFTSAIQMAISAGLKVGWSNDVFELWILLHFETIPTGYRLHRDYVYSRLTEVFKVIQPRTPDLDLITSHPQFNYKYSLKRKVHFLTHVLPRLKERVAIAIKNAETLEAIYDGKVPFHHCNPCTKVHHLVTELIKEQKRIGV